MSKDINIIYTGFSNKCIVLLNRKIEINFSEISVFLLHFGLCLIQPNCIEQPNRRYLVWTYYMYITNLYGLLLSDTFHQLYKENQNINCLIILSQHPIQTVRPNNNCTSFSWWGPQTPIRDIRKVSGIAHTCV